MFELALEEEGRDVQRRLYAHHDYFGNIIPSSWFVMGVILGAFVFYGPLLFEGLKAAHELARQLGEPTTGVDVVVAIILVVACFNVTYVVGQLLNGVAAVILDRVIVKKLLKYPFTLYELKYERRDDNKTDSELLREAVIDSTYAVYCVNLVPVIFFEFALLAFGRHNPHPGSWVQAHVALTFLLSLTLVCAHFGIPSFRKARQIASEAEEPSTARLELLVFHVTGILLATGLVGAAIAFAGWTWVVLLLPAANALIAIGDRQMLLQYGRAYKTPGMKRAFVYLRRTFLNPSYFAAKLVGYGAAPSSALIGKALMAARYDSKENDFYWMCQLRLENELPRSHDTAYHGMAMYTMNRNLCNSTAFVTIASVVSFYVHWPENYHYGALVWIAALCVCTYLFFVRYLYLFSGLYSKYVIRAAAFQADKVRPIVSSTTAS